MHQVLRYLRPRSKFSMSLFFISLFWFFLMGHQVWAFVLTRMVLECGFNDDEVLVAFGYFDFEVVVWIEVKLFLCLTFWPLLKSIHCLLSWILDYLWQSSWGKLVLEFPNLVLVYKTQIFVSLFVMSPIICFVLCILYAVLDSFCEKCPLLCV